MKKAFLPLVISTILILSGCFDSSNQNPDDRTAEGFHIYETNEFKIQVPDDWETLTPLGFKSDMPRNAIGAFRSNLKNARFTPNVIIVKNELSDDISTSDYAKTMRQKITGDLISFREILTEKTNVTVAGASIETLYIYVEGRDKLDSDIKRFIQISAVKGKTAYIAIGAFLTVPAQESDAAASKIGTMIRSFEVK